MRYTALILFPYLLFAASPAEILQTMTLEEKVGQLFIAPVCPNFEDSHIADWKQLLDTFHIGNAILKQGIPESQIARLNELQSYAKRPLLIVADAEWGLAMRMKEVPVFPKNMTLGAIQDLTLIERLGAEIGREARLVGIHMNLAPVVDVNNNPNNPVIHQRSFGDQPTRVAQHGAAMVHGLQQGGLLTCLKHFPGHGDTEADSHHRLPMLNHTVDHIKQIEMPPFEAGIMAQSDAVMSAHLLVPALDAALPATLSEKVMTGLLRDTLGFEGLIITDALNMRALSDHYSCEEIVIRAHAAGADLLLYGSHLYLDVVSLLQDQIPRAYRALLAAYQRNEFPLDRLDASVLRILQAKARFSEWLTESNPPLFTDEVASLKQELYEAAVTQIGTTFLPLDPETAYFSPCDAEGDFMRAAFCPCLCHTWEDREDLFDYERVVVSLRNIQPTAKNYGLTDEQLQFFAQLSSRLEVIYCLFGTPYAAQLLPKPSTILVGYEEAAQAAVLKILDGERSASGILPIHHD